MNQLDEEKLKNRNKKIIDSISKKSDKICPGLIDIRNFSPFPKNPVLARVFKEIGYADELGSGIRNMVKYLSVITNTQPQLIEEDIFKLIIPFPSNMHVDPASTPQVDNRTQRVIEFCQVPKSREEIQNFLELKDREYFRKNILKPLLDDKVLKLTIPDKPNSSKQKYYSEETLTKEF
ncbi:MAG: hypothetical protein JXR48_17795 [Candidatus Delongbacteria bacterium]|nr:hypothetical protein [Candidatus Delongbacteria bacterium]MBN2836812.1 hypothetical protein [Candidatus Delongbacteria bacterium]